MEQLAELARTGGPGWVVAFIAITAVVYLFRQLSKEREMCAHDWRTTVAGNTLQVKEWTSALLPFVAAMTAHTRAIELMTAEIATLSNAINRNSEVIQTRTEEAIQSHRQMREALVKRVDL
jgi:hypothetical protein